MSDLLDKQVGDVVYWNTNDFDSIKAESKKCTIAKILDDALLIKTDDMLLYIDKEDAKEEGYKEFTLNPLYEVKDNTYPPTVVDVEIRKLTKEKIEEEKNYLNGRQNLRENDVQFVKFMVKLNEDDKPREVDLTTFTYNKLASSRFMNTPKESEQIELACLDYIKKCLKYDLQEEGNFNRDDLNSLMNWSSKVKHSYESILRTVDYNENSQVVKALGNDNKDVDVSIRLQGYGDVKEFNDIEHIWIDNLTTDSANSLMEVAMVTLGEDKIKEQDRLNKEALNKYYNENIVHNFTKMNMGFYSDWYKDEYDHRPHIDKNIIEDYKKINIDGKEFIFDELVDSILENKKDDKSGSIFTYFNQDNVYEHDKEMLVQSFVLMFEDKETVPYKLYDGGITLKDGDVLEGGKVFKDDTVGRLSHLIDDFCLDLIDDNTHYLNDIPRSKMFNYDYLCTFYDKKEVAEKYHETDKLEVIDIKNTDNSKNKNKENKERDN